MNRFFLLLVFLGVLFGPVSAQNYVAEINDPDGYVNLREGPGVEFPVESRIEQKELFMYFSDDGSEWGRVVTSTGACGYIHRSRYRVLYADGYYPFAVSDPDPPANLRAGPGTQHRVVGKVANGEIIFTLLKDPPVGPDVRMILHETAWFRVVTGDGRTGYLHHDLLKFRRFDFKPRERD